MLGPGLLHSLAEQTRSIQKVELELLLSQELLSSYQKTPPKGLLKHQKEQCPIMVEVSLALSCPVSGCLGLPEPYSSGVGPLPLRSAGSHLTFQRVDCPFQRAVLGIVLTTLARDGIKQKWYHLCSDHWALHLLTGWPSSCTLSMSYYLWCLPPSLASQMALVVKNLPANAGDIRDEGSSSGSGRCPAGGHGNPLQYSHLENPMDRGIWPATVHRATKSQTRLKRLSTQHILPGSEVRGIEELSSPMRLLDLSNNDLIMAGKFG